MGNLKKGKVRCYTDTKGKLWCDKKLKEKEI